MKLTIPDRGEVFGFCSHETVAVLDPPPPLVGDTASHGSVVDADQLPPVQFDGLPVSVTVPEEALEPAVRFD